MARPHPPYCSEYYLLSAFTVFAIIHAAIVLYWTSSCIASRSRVLCYNLWFCVSHIFPPIIKITSFSKRPSTTVKSRNSKNLPPVIFQAPKAKCQHSSYWYSMDNVFSFFVYDFQQLLL